MTAQAFSLLMVWMPLLVQGTLCLAAGLAASYVLRSRPARAHQVLVVAVLACVMGPGLHLLAGRLGLGVLTPQVASRAGEATPEVLMPLDMPAADLAAAQDEVPVQADPEPVGPVQWPAADRVQRQGWRGQAVLGLGWIVASGALVVHLLLRFVLGLHLLCTAAPLQDGRLAAAGEAARANLGIRARVEIRSSDRVRSPIIWCWARRPILLVQRGRGSDSVRTDWVAVFSHELAHWRRRDHLSGLLIELWCAALPWHPLMWWAKRRMLLLSEQACDDWVLASGQVGVDYAESLLSLSPERQMAFVPTMVGKEKAMKTRIRRIVADQCGNPRIGMPWMLATVGLAGLIMVCVAVAQPGPAESVGSARMAEQPMGPDLMPQQGPRETRQRPDLDPQLAGRKNVLSRLRDQLQDQIRDTEAALRNKPNPEALAQVLRSELDTLREQMGSIERQLGQLGRRPVQNRPEAMRQEMREIPELEQRVAELNRRHQALSQKLRFSKDRLQVLGDGQVNEARELRGQIDQINGEIQDVERQRVGIQFKRSSPRRLALEGRLQELRNREDQIRGKMQQLGDQDRETANRLEQELDNTRAKIAETERAVQSVESEEWLVQNEAKRPVQKEQPLDQMEARRQQGAGEMITRVYKLRYANAEQIQKIVSSLLTKTGKVAADARTGSLIVADTPETHRRIEGVIRELDVEGRVPERPAGTEVDELRGQVKGLQEQMKKMQATLEQIASQKAKG